MTITGQGFAPPSLGGTVVRVCGLPCPSLKSITYTSAVCTVPPFVTASTRSTYQLGTETIIVPAAYLSSTPTSTAHSASAAFDFNLQTYFESNSNPAYVGFDAGANTQVFLSSIMFSAVSNSAYGTSRIVGGYFQASNTATSWTTIFVEWPRFFLNLFSPVLTCMLRLDHPCCSRIWQHHCECIQCESSSTVSLFPLCGPFWLSRLDQRNSVHWCASGESHQHYWCVSCQRCCEHWNSHCWHAHLPV